MEYTWSSTQSIHDTALYLASFWDSVLQDHLSIENHIQLFKSLQEYFKQHVKNIYSTRHTETDDFVHHDIYECTVCDFGPYGHEPKKLTS